MKRTALGVILVVCIIFLGCRVDEALAQSLQEIDRWIAQLQGRDWHLREDAAFRLMNLPIELRSDKVIKALIDELEKERAKKMATEGEVEYYSGLFDAVSAMKDERAFSFFAKSGSPSALVNYGDKGILVILEKLDEMKACNERIASIHYLGEVLKQKSGGYVAQGAVRERIRKTLIKELKENRQPPENIEWFEYRARECSVVRSRIVKALGYLAETGETDVIPLIRSIAENDPYFSVTKKTKKKGPYEVRDEAQKILKMLEAKGIK